MKTTITKILKIVVFLFFVVTLQAKAQQINYLNTFSYQEKYYYVFQQGSLTLILIDNQLYDVDNADNFIAGWVNAKQNSYDGENYLLLNNSLSKPHKRVSFCFAGGCLDSQTDVDYNDNPNYQFVYEVLSDSEGQVQSANDKTLYCCGNHRISHCDNDKNKLKQQGCSSFKIRN